MHFGGPGTVGYSSISGFTWMFRYKTVIGRRFHTRALFNQRTEAKSRAMCLNRMTGLGTPVCTRIG